MPLAGVSAVQPAATLSPVFVSALTADVGQFASVRRSPASAEMSAPADCANAWLDRDASSDARSAAIDITPMITSPKMTAGRANPRGRRRAARDQGELSQTAIVISSTQNDSFAGQKVSCATKTNVTTAVRRRVQSH